MEMEIDYLNTSFIVTVDENFAGLIRCYSGSVHYFPDGKYTKFPKSLEELKKLVEVMEKLDQIRKELEKKGE